MTAALGILLALLALEGLLLVAWPAHVRAIISQTSPGVLRLAGVVELLIVLILLVIAAKLI